MRNPNGYAIIVDPDAPTWERDTAQCCHCSAIIFVKPNTVNTVYLINMPDGTWKEEPGAGCFRCGNKPVCLNCYALGVCTPLERMLEQLEGKKSAGRMIL
jgi:hypothetical protein